MNTSFLSLKMAQKLSLVKSGILGHDNQLITWEELEILKNKYTKKD
jgi:hypothetical protein